MTTLYNPTSYTIILDFSDMFQDYFSIYLTDTYSPYFDYYINKWITSVPCGNDTIVIILPHILR